MSFEIAVIDDNKSLICSCCRGLANVRQINEEFRFVFCSFCLKTMIASFRHTWELTVGTVYPKMTCKSIIWYTCPAINRGVFPYKESGEYNYIVYNKNTQMLEFYIEYNYPKIMNSITAYVPFCEL